MICPSTELLQKRLGKNRVGAREARPCHGLREAGPFLKQFGRGTNYSTIWLKIKPKLHQNCTQKTRHKLRTKLAAALRAAANLVR